MENLTSDCQSGKGRGPVNGPQVPVTTQVPQPPDLADDLLRALNLILGVRTRMVDRVRLRAWVAELPEERREEILAGLFAWDAQFGSVH